MSSSQESTIKSRARSIIFKVPGARRLWTRWVTGKPGIHEFTGWGMTTNTFPPWHEPANDLAKDFLKAHESLVKAVLAGKFKLAQWDAVKDKEALLRGLMWRHFVVFWSARYARSAAGKDLAECGVCDGLTVYFALTAAGDGYKAWLYDAWEGMTADFLLESEKSHLGDYSYLSIDDTKKNLAAFDTVFIKGFIPESFKTSHKPTAVVWLHVDLNASRPTTDSLHEFYERVSPGGVILFDDYAGRGFADTKVAIDTFFSDKKGILQHLPTGQAIFFKQ